MKRIQLIVLSVVGLATIITALAYFFTKTPRFFLLKLGRAIDSDNQTQVEALVDTDKTVNDVVEGLVSLLKADILTSAQSTNNGFEAFGGMLAISAIDSMSDVLETRLSTQIETELGSLLERLDQPVTGYLLTQPIQKNGNSTATVTISIPEQVDWNIPLESLEVEIARIDGYWKIVGLSDHTISEIYEARQPLQNQASSQSSQVEPEQPQAQTRNHNATNRSVSPVPVAQDQTSHVNTDRDSVIGFLGSLIAENPTARINLRDEPNANTPTRRYGLVGDEVLIQDVASGNDGYTWYKVQFQKSGAVGWIRSDFVEMYDY